jgi:hypothetical protein
MLLLLGANDGSTQRVVGETRGYCGDMTDSPHLGAANDVDDAVITGVAQGPSLSRPVSQL